MKWLLHGHERVHVAENCGGMTIEVTSAAGANALADYLGRCGCTVTFVRDRVLDVEPPARSQDSRQAAIEIDAYLRVWRAMFPMHGAVPIDPAE
jgi:hypothetical protein